MTLSVGLSCTGGRPAGRALHVVQIGWDATLFDERAASDARARQRHYAELLAARRPGSRMTILVLGAPEDARAFAVGNLSVVPLGGRWASLARVHAALARLDRQAPISVIAAQSPLEDGWAALAFARRRIPVVAQVHFDLLSDAALPGGSRARALAGAARRRLALALLPRYRMVRAVAAGTADGLKVLGARAVRLIPVPILDLATFEAVADVPRHAPRVLFVGRLAPEKNLGLWLAVARRVLDRVPDAQFDIVGDGAERRRIEEEARRLGLESAVTFHGGQTRPELPSSFARASVLLLTSDHEGLPRVLIEAMAAGVAVDSTRNRGAVEVVGEGDAGRLAPLGDAEGLANAVSALLTDDELRARTIAAATARIHGRYDPLSLAGAWVDMLIEAAERQPIARGQP